MSCLLAGGQNYTYVLLNRRVIEEIRKDCGNAVREKYSTAHASATDASRIERLRTSFVLRLQYSSRVEWCWRRASILISFSMSLQSRALGKATTLALRSRLLSLPPSCRILSLESAVTKARHARHTHVRSGSSRPYSTERNSSVLENFKGSCKYRDPPLTIGENANHRRQ